MRVAIIHPWFLSDGGGERVTTVLAEMYPEADIFALFSDDRHLPEELRGRNLKTSFLNALPGGRKLYRQLLPLYPIATEMLDLTGYDLIISSDPSVCKGVLSDQTAVHISYCHTPTRFIWDYFVPFYNKQPRLLRPVYALTAHYLRMWDYQAAQRVDHFVANSGYIANRIRKYYRRDSVVIHPPVNTINGYLASSRDDYYLSVGRFTETKRIDLLIHACNETKRPLLIAGSGRDKDALKAIAGPTVRFLGRVPDEDLPNLYARCRAFLFAAEEDFGIVPLEAHSFGRPVIAFGRGGAREVIRGHGETASPTGIFFAEQKVEDIVAAIYRFERVEDHFNPEAIKAHAATFDTSVFVERMRRFVDESISAANRSRDTISTAKALC
jgi:glycosyltransferase involved in cell wall biosynthesis